MGKYNFNHNEGLELSGLELPPAKKIQLDQPIEQILKELKTEDSVHVFPVFVPPHLSHLHQFVEELSLLRPGKASFRKIVHRIENVPVSHKGKSITRHVYFGANIAAITIEKAWWELELTGWTSVRTLTELEISAFTTQIHDPNPTEWQRHMLQKYARS